MFNAICKICTHTQIFKANMVGFTRWPGIRWCGAQQKNEAKMLLD